MRDHDLSEPWHGGHHRIATETVCGHAANSEGQNSNGIAWLQVFDLFGNVDQTIR
jgi:hypothetical protein